MPVAHSGDTELYWESTGAGAPVLLVMGLGMNATGWWRTVPVLAERFRVLAFDNRGVGRSARPPGSRMRAKTSIGVDRSKATTPSIARITTVCIAIPYTLDYFLPGPIPVQL